MIIITCIEGLWRREYDKGAMHMLKRRTGEVLIFGLLIFCLSGCVKKDEVVLSFQEEETRSSDISGNTVPDCEPEYVVVHICGAVASPGVYQIEIGSRIYEAIKLAGGFTQEASTEYWNLAQAVEDEMQIFIPTREEAADAFVQQESLVEGVRAGEKYVNINLADKAVLCTLPGIGEARAESIILYRETKGAFQTIEDIMLVDGIKEKAFEKIKDKITVK